MTTGYALADLDTVLVRHGMRRTAQPQAVSGGTLNLNLRVPTEAGPLFARRYRRELDPERLSYEHAVTNWVAGRGIPAVAPLVSPDGETVVEVSGARWSLFPWVDGRPPIRGKITPSEAIAIGDVHGRIQRALAEHPDSDGRTLQALSDDLTLDSGAAVEQLAALERAAAEQGVPPAIAEAIAFQRQLLEDGHGRPFSDFAWLPIQLLHRDFHDQQVLLGPDQSDSEPVSVLGIVDWEMTSVEARVWELVRSLASLLPDADAHLRRFADDTWRTRISDRLVAAFALAI